MPFEILPEYASMPSSVALVLVIVTGIAAALGAAIGGR